MQREERAIVTPAAKVLLVALLVTVARSESRDEPAADFESESGNALSEPSRSAFSGGARSPCRDRCPQGRGVLCGRPAQLEPPGLGAQAMRSRRCSSTSSGTGRHVRWCASSSPSPVARIDAVRKSLRIASVQGRPKLPPLREREAIVAAWIRLEGTEDRRARYHALHRNFPGYSIAALDSVLQELSPERSATPRPAGNRPAAAPVSAPRARQADEPAARRAYRRAPSCPQVTDAERRDSR